MPDLMREVAQLVPSQSGAFFWRGLDGQITNSYIKLPLSVQQLYFAEFYETHHEGDVIATLVDNMTSRDLGLVVRISESLRVDHRDFLRSDFYNIFWRAAECHEPLMLRIRDARAKLWGIMGVPGGARPSIRR